jgi:uncharacterized protein (TIGR00369 family)
MTSFGERAREHEPLAAEAAEVWARFGKWDRPYFVSHVGIVVEETRRDYCRMRLPFRPELEQPMGIVHGGAIATLLDVVVVPAIGGAYEPGVGYSTVSLDIQYMSALVGEDAGAEGWVVKRGRTLVFCEAEVVGLAIARAHMTYHVSQPRP